jgi:hypothetical protein
VQLFLRVGAIPKCTFREIDQPVKQQPKFDYEHLVGQEEEVVIQLRQGWPTRMAVCRSAIVTKWSLNELSALLMLEKHRLGVFPQ